MLHCDSWTTNAINKGEGCTLLTPLPHKETPIKGIYKVLNGWLNLEKVLVNLTFRTGLAAARPLIHRPSSLQPQQTWLLSSVRVSSYSDAQVRRSSHYTKKIKTSIFEEYFWSSFVEPL